MSELPKIIVITGPTGSGKSSLALDLARRLEGELINADSVQVYKDFDIGSAKPSREEMTLVPHHLFSVLDPSDHFDAEIFRQMAAAAIASVLKRGCVPIIVGGTGLYVRSLLCGLVPLSPIAPEVTREIEEREQTWLEELRQEQADPRELKLSVSRRLHDWLLSIDERTAKTLHPSDANRIKRALSVTLGSGDSLRALQELHAHSCKEYQPLVVCIAPEREALYEKINARVDSMFDNGFADEVRMLREKYEASCRAFSSLGYRHVLAYLNGETSEEEMRRTMKRDTRHFAKRQLTWWRNQPEKLGWKLLEADRFLDAADKSAAGIGGCEAGESQTLSDKLTAGILRFLGEKSSPQSGVVEFLSISDMDVAPKRCNSL